MIKKQSIETKKGEVNFRRNLTEFQVEGKQTIHDEYSRDKIESILKERMRKTFDRMNELLSEGYSIPTYLEIGAERCQRSLVMENDLNLSGVALDISYDMLKSCEDYKVAFNKKKNPMRICADAENLPFASNSLPFVFCYETLHHFPDPTAVINEIYRVLKPGGIFFFDEEPYKNRLHFDLYKGSKAYSDKNVTKNKFHKILDYFFLELNCNETEYGIIENLKIPIKTWRDALNIFEDKEVVLSSIKGLSSDLFKPTSYLKLFIAKLFGGGIAGKCKKAGISNFSNNSISNYFVCPSCLENGNEPLLIQNEKGFTCKVCDYRSPIIDGVGFLLANYKFKILYPEFHKAFFTEKS